MRYGTQDLPFHDLPEMMSTTVDSLQWEHFLLDVLWILPIVVGMLSVGYAALTLRKKNTLSTVLTCFVLTVLVVALGAFGTWRGGLQIWIVTGVAGDISLDLLYAGWRRSWLPMITAGVATAGLMTIALFARARFAGPKVQ